MKKYLFIGLMSISVTVGFLLLKLLSTPMPYTFYYWKQKVAFLPDKSVLYVKCQDVGYDGKLTILSSEFDIPSGTKIVPVIYIENRVFIETKPEILVENLLEKFEKQCQRYRFTYDEIQFDCDWSASTRVAYFELLRNVKRKTGRKISATIRLHQISYARNMGVPPVDRGVLMYYNMSDFSDVNTQNYILDTEVAKTYLKHSSGYPLSLDIALPLYSQATIIRFGEVVGFIEGVHTAELDRQFIPIGQNRYKIRKSGYFKGKMLYEGDIIRIDEVTEKALKQAIQDIKSSSLHGISKIIFFRYENKEEYSQDTIERVIKSF